MNENDAYIFDVEEPREWVFKGEPVWISGWFLSKTGAGFSDIRAVIDGIPHLGILGMPRPEIEERHRGQAGLPRAGFLLRVSPPASARTLRIELLDAGHHWVEIWRTSIKVSRGGPAGGRWLVYESDLEHFFELLAAEPAEASTRSPSQRTRDSEAAGNFLDSMA